MKRSILVCAACVLVLMTVIGCKKKEAATPAPMAPMSQAQQPGAGAPPAMPAPDAVAVSGKIVETMNAGGYTYVCLENSGKKTWVAMPMTQVKVGQEVKCQPGMVMKNFTSPTLKRNFESIVFSGGLVK